MREKIVMIGAGSAMFTRGLVADLVGRGEEIDVALVDPDPEALAVAEGLARKMIAAAGAPITLSAAVDRRDVLPGATVVICTVGVGGRRAWEQDVFIPRRYGIYQPVGDTVGPGGTSRAMRMIPAMVAIAEDVLDLAPTALFFNYGNPMAPVCRAIRKATGAPVIGLCHGVTGVAGYLARALGVPTEELQYSAVGINHLTWFVEVRTGGGDAMPRLHEIARERAGQTPTDGLGRRFAEAGDKGGNETPTDNPFSWRLFSLFDAFPAVLDRHVCEFFPQFFARGEYYGKTLGVDAYSIERTIAGGDRIYEEMREVALSDQPLGDDARKRSGGEHEQVTDIIADIRSGRNVVYSANLPNTGQVANLPPNAVIESPAVTDASGLRAIAQPPLPTGVAGTLATRFQWVETVVEAALEGSREKFIQALVLDGAVASLETAASIADDLLAAHEAHLPWVATERDASASRTPTA
jgi:alpha-galactosidase